jgi:cytochrome P450
MQTFGSGMHYRLGADLAMPEVAEALAVMTTRMPNARRTAAHGSIGARASERSKRPKCPVKAPTMR